MGLKEQLLDRVMKLMSDPRVMKFMSDPKVMNAVSRAFELQAKAQAEITQLKKRLAEIPRMLRNR